MSAPMMMNFEQVSEGPFQQMFAQPVQCVFVAAPEFCEGMYVPPLGGYEAAWSQGAHRFPSHQRQGRNNPGNNRIYGAPRLPKPFVPNDFGNTPMWPQQDVGSQEPVAVELSGLPAMLCTKKCLEAAIDQAGLENDVQSFELKTDNNGEATLIMANERAAKRCVQHFNGLQWAKSSKPVSAHYQLPQPPPPQEEPVQATNEAFETETTNEALNLGKDLAVTPLTLTPKSAPKLSPKSSFSGSPSMKPRWADLDSDDDNDDIISKSTRAGTWDSVPGSSDSGEASNSEQD